MNEALIHHGDNDYELKEDYLACWVKVGDISVYIRRKPTDDTVEVRLCAYGAEDDKGQDLDSASAFQQDARDLLASRES